MSATHSHLDSLHDPNPLHRFQQHSSAPYYLSHPQPGLEPLSTSISHPPFQSRQQPWMLNVQTSYTTHQHHQAGAGALSPERAQGAHANFYSGAGPESQLVGYPESSQRTPLLQDPTYANLYNVSFSSAVAYPPHAPGAFSPTAAATPAEELQSALDSHTLARGPGSYRSAPPMPPAERRASFGLATAGQFIDGARADLYGSGAPARYVNAGAAASYPPSFAGLASPTSPYAHSHAHSHSHSHHSHSHSHSHGHLGSDSGALMDMHSPRSAPYPIPMRRDSMDSVSVPDPISPSSVPGLVFDGDDYDDDSESSLPSAASEVHRLPYHRTPSNEERDFELASRDWPPRAPADGASYGGGAPSAHSGSGLDDLAASGRGQARSPEPAGADGEHMGSTPVTPSEGPQHERTRPPQKKSKMHQCTVCFKLFPRPSGLATHMNSHSGAKRASVLSTLCV